MGEDKSVPGPCVGAWRSSPGNGRRGRPVPACACSCRFSARRCRRGSCVGRFGLSLFSSVLDHQAGDFRDAHAGVEAGLANEEIAFFVEAAQHERLLFGEDALLAHILILRQLVLGPPPTTPLSTTGTCQLEKTENCIRRTGFRTTRAVRSERRINLEGEFQRTSVRQCCQQHCWKVGNKRNGSPVWTRFELSPPS